MQLFLNDVDNFFTSKEEKAYQQHSRPYKKGYLIEGAPGTGKTTVIEAVAMIHNMSIYMVNLNSAEMTDSVLINLIANVPPRSLIVFDEMDKQYEAIQKNQNIHLSTGGILNALDGPQRLSHGTIVVMIVNNLNKFDDDFRIPLLRPGRIDKVFQFTIVI
jgi:SpoVK/Ycf46/Vps4 family AAA+-type ATPase